MSVCRQLNSELNNWIQLDIAHWVTNSICETTNWPEKLDLIQNIFKIFYLHSHS